MNLFIPAMIPVQYIISTEQDLPILSHVKTALKSGCTWIQLKNTKQYTKDFVETIKEIKMMCRESGATFIIEDDIKLVKEIEGDGIHITDSTPIYEVRKELGEGFLIGGNASSAEDTITMKQQSADYICLGPFCDEGNNKPNINISQYKQILSALEARSIYIPICAFGHIRVQDVPTLLNCGINGISIQIEEKKLNENLIGETIIKYLNA